MRILGVLFIVISLFIAGCKKDSNTDLLSGSALLGEWELTSISNDFTMQCCEFMTFDTDENPDDFIGIFNSRGVEFTTTGSFEYFEVDETILFSHDGNYTLNDITISSDYLILTNQDNNGEPISREYRKI